MSRRLFLSNIIRCKWLRTASLLLCLLCALPCLALQEQSVCNIKRGIESADSLYRKQKYIDALDGYISQLSLLHRNESDSLYLVILSRIGTVYDLYDDQPRALYYYEKVLTDPAVTKYGDIYSKLLVKMVIGYYNSGEAAKARIYYRKQLDHPIAEREIAGYYRYTNGGLLESLEKRPARALPLYRKALAHCRKEGMEPVFRVPVMLEMAACFRELHRPDSALRYLTEASNICEREHLNDYAADCYESLYRHYKSTGDSATAARYLELYSTTSDSLAVLKKLDMASLRLLQSHDVHARQEITELNTRIDLQAKTLLFILLFCAAITAFALYTRRQHKRLKASYRLLIEKSDEIFHLEEQQAPLPPPEPVPSENSENSEAPEAAAQPRPNPLLERINAALGDIELISRPNFSLTELCREVGSNSKYVSSIINEAYGKNFRTILNERRIREATRRLTDTANYGDCSIADIADSLGYSSATVFINAFKKVIGMTPAVYRRYRNG